MLITLYPALIKFAEAELRAHGLSLQEAEDIAQEAARRWTEVTGTEEGARTYLHALIRGRVRNLHREGRDVMTRHPLSLEEIAE